MGRKHSSAAAVVSDQADLEICFSLTLSSNCQYKSDTTDHPILQYWKKPQ